MTSKRKINRALLLSGLRDLAYKQYQIDIWLNQNNPDGLVDSFVEAVIAVFDDTGVIDALRAQQIILNSKVTQALWDLHDATDAVDEYQSQEDIINDPLMQIVRLKAAYALALIEASDGKESTVEIIE